jgi:glycosyltransferase involved in cell wall biosynthesis
MDEGLQSGAYPIMRKTICILAFSHIARDARVLRQIKYLSPFYDLIIIGYGPPHSVYTESPNIKWIQLGNVSQEHVPNLITALKTHDIKNIRFWTRVFHKVKQLRNKTLSLLGIIFPQVYEAWYWMQIQNREAWQHVINIQCHAYHANDWDMLPIAAHAARKNTAKLVLDLHEYAPLEYEELPHWWIKKRFITYILKKYSPYADTIITIAQPIADRYRNEFGFDSDVIMNVPEQISFSPHVTNKSSIKLIHHGGASKLRQPELMIETIARCNDIYSLHFMFLPNEYVEKLKIKAEKIAPGRVFFHNPVSPEEITQELSQYDVGFYILPPTNYNNHVALPNKFLDFICAGLAVCIGPSPSMAALVKKHGFGVVCNSFNPEDVASMLNKIPLDHWENMRQAARVASNEINAQNEMKKLMNIFDRILS